MKHLAAVVLVLSLLLPLAVLAQNWNVEEIGVIDAFDTREWSVENNLLAVEDHTLNDILIYDISTPSDPVLTGSIEISDSYYNHNFGIANGYLFFRDNYNDYLSIYNISTGTPELFTTLNLYPSLPVITKDQYIFIYGNNILYVYTVDADEFVLVGQYAIDEELSSHYIYNNYYIYSSNETNKISFLDIHDVYHISYISEFRHPDHNYTYYNVKNLYMDNRFLYVFDGSGYPVRSARVTVL
ncbi:hypothetical protein KQI52_11840 [bacterium]|nr:hypothetical protein [bacterium]